MPGQIKLGQQFGVLFLAHSLVYPVKEAQVPFQHAHKARQIFAFQLGRTLAVTNRQAFRGALEHDLVESILIFDVLLGLPLLDGKQWGLRDENVAPLDQILHVAEEKRQQQGADVAAVDVGVGHEDDLAVTNFGGIEIIFRDARAQRRNHGADFLVRQHLVVASFFDVKNFSLQGQDGLKAAVAALFRSTTGGFTLNQEELATVGI